VLTMWARGDANTTVRNSLWYRFPNEQPTWLPNGMLRVFAGMGPGELQANTWGDPHCGHIIDHLPDQEAKDTYKALRYPNDYMSKALWLPPGTPDHIADALSAAFQNAFANDEDLNQKYAAIAGESPLFTDRATGTKATAENEALYQEAAIVIKREGDRIIRKYFPELVSN
jgi:hypothetical protein